MIYELNIPTEKVELREVKIGYPFLYMNMVYIHSQADEMSRHGSSLVFQISTGQISYLAWNTDVELLTQTSPAVFERICKNK